MDNELISSFEYSDSEHYTDWISNLIEINELKDTLRNKVLAGEEIKAAIVKKDPDGCIGLEFSDHAIKKLTAGLESLADDSLTIAADYFSSNSFRAMSRLSNAQNFVLTAMSRAYADGKVVRKKSQSTQSANGAEFHYNCRIESWIKEDRIIEMTVVVESNKIKTLFFNWVRST